MAQEAMSKENWERIDKGLPPIKKVKIVRPEPEKPKIENEIKFDDIAKTFVSLESAKRSTEYLGASERSFWQTKRA